MRDCDRAKVCRKYILHYSKSSLVKSKKRMKRESYWDATQRAHEQFNFEKFAAKISRLRSCVVLRDELHSVFL